MELSYTLSSTKKSFFKNLFKKESDDELARQFNERHKKDGWIVESDNAQTENLIILRDRIKLELSYKMSTLTDGEIKMIHEVVDKCFNEYAVKK